MIMTIDEVKEAIKETTVDKYQIGDTAYVIEKAEEGWLLKVMIFGKRFDKLGENLICDYYVRRVQFDYTFGGLGVFMETAMERFNSKELIDEKLAKAIVYKYEEESLCADENRRKNNERFIITGGRGKNGRKRRKCNTQTQTG